MNTTDRFYEAAAEIWDSYYAHPFVEGIREGTLDPEKFRWYIVQDYLYLKEYARLFALGAAKAPDLDTMHMFAERCMAILDTEMKIHESYMERLQIPEQEIAGARMALDNASYVSYMLRIAYEQDAAAVCASILACAVSYEVLAKRMIRERPACADDPMFGEWVRGYADEAYAADNAVLNDYMNRLTEGCSEERIRELTEIFVTCSRFEKAFWDMGWEMRE